MYLYDLLRFATLLPPAPLVVHVSHVTQLVIQFLHGPHLAAARGSPHHDGWLGDKCPSLLKIYNLNKLYVKISVQVISVLFMSVHKHEFSLNRQVVRLSNVDHEALPLTYLWYFKLRGKAVELVTARRGIL